MIVKLGVVVVFLCMIMSCFGDSWMVGIPVATSDVCDWTTDSICYNEFFSANGMYNSSWSGSFYFNDYTPNYGVLQYLEIELFGSFGSTMEPSTMTITINDLSFASVDYTGNYTSNCTLGTDSISTKSSVSSINLQSSNNILTFGFAEGFDVYACGVYITGYYDIVSSPDSWIIEIPVETSDTCEWKSFSECSTTFFNAYGEYNQTWDGSFYFNDPSPSTAILQNMAIELYGAFEPATDVLITVFINDIPWTTIDYNQTFTYNCQQGTDSISAVASALGIQLKPTSNLITFDIQGNVTVNACGVVLGATFINPVWTVSAPVETSDTCAWDSTSICSTDFFNAHGIYNQSWTGSVYFNDLTLEGYELEYLEVELYGAFETNVTSTIPILINDNNWTSLTYDGDFTDNCTLATDSMMVNDTLSGIQLNPQSNLLTFEVPSDIDIAACGVVITGYTVESNGNPSSSPSPSPSISQSKSITPSRTTTITPSPSVVLISQWTYGAPVETSETCSWTSTSTCSTMYFNAHGQYNVSWNGQVYFENLSPPQLTLTSLTAEIYGSFESSNAVEIPVLINGVQWAVWNTQTNYTGDCETGTDSALISGDLQNIIFVNGDSNILSFDIPEGGPIISACGVTIRGVASQVNTASQTPSITPTTTVTISITPTTTGTISISPSISTSTTSTPTPSISHSEQPQSQISTWIVSVSIGALVVIVVVTIIGIGVGFYQWKSKQLNGYAIME